MKNPDRIFQIITIGAYIIIFLFISQNLRYPYLWFDESVQFWVSKGLSPDSDPLSKTGGIINVIENNKYYNMDPGGFGILLHFWSKISNHHFWLRFLPFIFFIAIILSFIYISYKWLKNFNIALLIGFIPMLYPMILNMGFEIRAYSMEALGAILCIIAIEQLKNKINFKNLFFWSCIFSLFITSRYSLIIVVFVTSLYVLYLIYNKTTILKNRLVYMIVYSIPLISILCYIYFFALFYQNANIQQLSYLPYLSKNIFLLFQPFNFLYLSTIGIYIILFFVKNKYHFLRKYDSLLFITIIVNLLFVVLSLIGKHPWDPTSNRCISMVLLVLICLAEFVGELLKPLFDSKDITKYYLMSLIFLFIIYERNSFLLLRIRNNMNTFYNFTKVDLKQFDKIYVDRWESPYIKYLFEYSTFKSEVGNIYPNKFTFIKANRHSINDGNETLEEYYIRQPKMNELINYDLLITPELFRKGNNDKWVLLDNTTNFWIQRDR